MRRNLLILTTLTTLALLMALTVWGCKNPDQQTNPVVPNPQAFNPGGPIDPGIPTPFAEEFGTVLDIAIEGDGDIVIADVGGQQLFTPYGVFKRPISTAPYFAVATSNFGALDTGRGTIGLSPAVNDCTPSAQYDDEYVTGGVPHITYILPWWGGEADPFYPDACVSIASTSSFSSCDCTPHPLAYHPETGIAYQKVNAPDCIADSDCEWPFGNTVPGGGDAILAYHPLAPLIPDFMFSIMEGGQDFLVYYDFPTFMRMQNNAAGLGVVPACALHSLFIVWDITNTMTYMSDRDGMVASNICDFEFDMLNRLIIAMPNADSVAITEPVVFGNPIIIQQVLGGRQNGMGTLPGEFQGPTAVAIDPRNQNILISDTGNGRVQVFDNDGNFIREFGGADPTFVPRAIRVDAFGAIYVANWSDDPQATNLRIFNEYGERVQYGTIEGYVYDKVTQIPLDNTRVSVLSTFNRLDTVTDGDGHFIFTAVAAGTHDITADKFGFFSAQAVVTVSGGHKTMVDLYLERSGTEPAGYGQVTGTVFTNLYNEPVPGLTAEIVGLGISNQTNGNGEFILYNVPTGEHTFRLTANGVIYYEKYITVTNGEIVDLGLLYLPIPVP